MDKPVSPVARLSCPRCNSALEIGGDVERFACAHCGTEYVVNRAGGIITLTPAAELLQEESAEEAARRRLVYQVDQLEKDIETEMNRYVAGMPAYQRLRFDYARLGKINFIFVGIVNEKTLQEAFRSLTIADVDRLIEYYSRNPGSPTGDYLKRLHGLMAALKEKREQLGK